MKKFLLFLTVSLMVLTVSAQESDYTLISGSADLVDGASYLLAYGEGADGSYNFFKGVAGNIGTYKPVEVAGYVAKYEDVKAAEVMLLTLKKSGDNWAFETSDGKYLGWKTDGGNKLYALDDVSDASSWTLTFGETLPNVVIANVETPARVLQWNATSPRFACYEGSQKTPYLFKLGDVTTKPTPFVAPEFTKVADLLAYAKETPVKVTMADWLVVNRNGNNMYVGDGVDSVLVFDYNIPKDWAAGGKLSGTIEADYSYYAKNEVWELKSVKSWDGVTYTAGGDEKQEFAITVGEITGLGTVTAPEKAKEGDKVSITAVPGDNYEFTSWNVFKTGEEATKVEVADNEFAMPAYDVTVSAVFTEKQAPAKKLFYTMLGKGSESELVAGSVILLGAEVGDSLTFAAGPLVSGTIYTYPSVKFAKPEDGINVDSMNVTIASEPDKNKAVFMNNAHEFILEAGKTEGTWLFKDPVTKKYLNWKSGNTLRQDVTGSEFTISFYVDNKAIITVAATPERTLQYNSSSPRFACYTTAQAAVYIYKKGAEGTIEKPAVPFVAPTFTKIADLNAYEWQTAVNVSMDNWLVVSNDGKNLRVKDALDGKDELLIYNTKTPADYKANYYVSGTIKGNWTYYNKIWEVTNVTVWDSLKAIPTYPITIAEGLENGKAEASLEFAKEGDEVSLTATPDKDYEVVAWNVTKTEDAATKVEVADDKFAMPAYAVTVSATFDLTPQAKFANYKTEKLPDADALADPDDSKACEDLIANAKSEIEKLAYDTSKSLDGNKEVVDNMIDKLGEDLDKQREADFESFKKGIIESIDLDAMAAECLTVDAFATEMKAKVGALKYNAKKSMAENVQALNDLYAEFQEKVESTVSAIFFTASSSLSDKFVLNNFPGNYVEGKDVVITALGGNKYKAVFPGIIKEIKENAFSATSSLTAITLPASLEKIGDQAFLKCTKLTSVTLNSLPVFGENAFRQVIAPITLELVDEYRPYVAEEMVNAPTFYSVKYIRELPENQFGTIVLPFVPKNVADFKFYTVESAEEGKLMLAEVEDVQAGVPYFYTSEAGATEMIAKNQNLVLTVTDPEPVGGWQMTGAFRYSTLTGENLYVLQDDNQLHNTTANINMIPFRAYLDYTEPGPGAVFAKVQIELADAETTGIKEVGSEKLEAGSAIFNLAGQAVGADYKGIVIINGKKYLNR